jgi:dihydroflavonol-4-reductase
MREALPTLVTGASGHIGANLVRALLDRGRRVRALIHESTAAIEGLSVEVVRADLLDRESVLRACRDAGTVFHLAGKVSAGWEPEAAVNAINVTGTGNVVEGCLASGVRRLLHFSSIQALAPKPGTVVVDERCDLVPASDRAHGSYDRAKANAERLVLAAVARGLDAVVVNPTAVIGPFDFQRSPMGEVLAALGRGKLPALVAGGHCDFVDARDVAEGALAAEAHGLRGERYILSGTRLSLVELARQWAVTNGRPAPRLAVPMILARAAAPLAPAWARWRGRRPLFTSESLRVLRTQPPASHHRAAVELGYGPRPIAETLRDTCAWMRTQGWL